MAIPRLGPKAVAGIFTDAGVLKLFLDDDTHLDVPLVMSASGSIVDNADGTVSITIP
jgi:hypothetical protein